MQNELLAELVWMSNELGNPGNDYAILGEGNTSARINDQSFWVKASGAELASASTESFVQVAFEPVLALLQKRHMSDAQTKQGLMEARLDQHARGIPSIETVLHALCLQYPQIQFVGHTHPTAINMLTCAKDFELALSGRVLPDEIVVCGPAAVLVPYADPGLPLAGAVQRGLQRYLDVYGEIPKTIYMQNRWFHRLRAESKAGAQHNRHGEQSCQNTAGHFQLRQVQTG